MKTCDCEKHEQPDPTPKPPQDPCDPSGKDKCDYDDCPTDSDSCDEKLAEIDTQIMARTQEKAALQDLKTRLTKNETTAATARSTYAQKYESWKHFFECECSCAHKRVECEKERLGDKANEVIECLGEVKCEDKPDPCKPFDCDDFPPCDEEPCDEKRRSIAKVRLTMAQLNVSISETTFQWITGLSARLEIHKATVEAIKKADDETEDYSDDCDLPGLRRFIVAKVLECHSCRCLPTPCKYDEEIDDAADALRKAYCRQLKETNRYNEAGGNQTGAGSPTQQPTTGGTSAAGRSSTPAAGSATGTAAGTTAATPADWQGEVTSLIKKVRDCMRGKRKEPCEKGGEGTPQTGYKPGETGEQRKPPGSK